MMLAIESFRMFVLKGFVVHAFFTASHLPATGITLGHATRYASTSFHVSVSSLGRLSPGPMARRRFFTRSPSQRPN